VASTGGAIMSHGGTIESLYVWGLGIASNNTIEAYTLLQGLRLVIQSSIQSLILVDYLKIVIGKMVSIVAPYDNLLTSMLEQEKKEALNFTSIKFFQVLWEIK
jgi:hypothetical protein